MKMKSLKIILFTILILLLSALLVSADDCSDGYIVKMPENAGISLMSAMPDDAEYCGKGIYVVDTLEEAQALKGYAEYIEPNHTFYLHGYDYSTIIQNNYILDTVNIMPMWDYGFYGNDVLIGVIDTGCTEHNLLSGALVEGHNFLAATDEDKTDVTDTNGHGTGVAGLIAARCGSSYAIGTAHHAKIMPLKIFKGNTTSASAVCQAIYYAVDNGCKIINLSSGSPEYSITLENAVEYAYEHGVIFVSSVGNNATGQAEPANEANYLSYPASFEHVIGVGALDTDGNRLDYSHYNESVFVMAPGKSLYSTHYDGTKIARCSGTSYSTPIVTGIIADMLSIDEKLTPDDVEDIIIKTSNRKEHFWKTQIWNIEYGYGVIDAGAIREYLLSDKDWIVSPIDMQTDTPEITVIKNNNYDYSPVAIMKKDDGTYKSEALAFTTSEMMTLQFDEGAEAPVFVLWKDKTSIMPLAPKRSVEK